MRVISLLIITFIVVILLYDIFLTIALTFVEHAVYSQVQPRIAV